MRFFVTRPIFAIDRECTGTISGWDVTNCRGRGGGRETAGSSEQIEGRAKQILAQIEESTTGGADDWAALAHPAVTRHRDTLTNGTNGDGVLVRHSQ